MTRTCYETGADLPETMHEKAHFSSDAARTAWNNRRKNRGAILYDLFMGYRYDRGVAKTLGLFSVMCALAAKWRAEDKAAGRRSHNEPAEAVSKVNAV